MTVGFLHTAPAHVTTFQGLMAGMAPDLSDVHVVDASLLGDARERGVDVDIRGRLELRLRELVARGAEVVACTCSTLGGAAEDLSAAIGVPVLRIDRPMAELAVEIGGRIGVVVALASTLSPTLDLLRACALLAGTEVVLVESPCLTAWEHFVAHDLTGYAEALVGHVRDLAPRVDVVVLAQASMAPALERLADLPVRVLCSPQLGVARAAEMVRHASLRIAAQAGI